MIDAERFDFGVPDDFVTSMQRFRGKIERPLPQE
jgi:hypothetical protein